VNLTAVSRAARISSAWGLLNLDDRHPEARDVIRTEGTPADCRRMESNASRRRSLERFRARPRAMNRR
jgi:hypothetical protein